MEKKLAKWGFKNQKEANPTIRDILVTIEGHLNKNYDRPLIHLGRGDPSSYPSFRTTPLAQQAILNALHSTRFNGYSPAAGISQARTAVAKYLSDDLPYELSEEDVFLTAGGNHAIEVILRVLSLPGANILLPSPGYPVYEAVAAFTDLQVRHFDLLPDKEWEVDLDGVEALADDNTIAMVVINPGNPCGNVFSLEHMQKIAETAGRLGIVLISDEVYYHIVFGNREFVPMGVLGSVTPVLTLGSISKRWLVPGWRLGWIAATDPNGLLTKSGVIDSLNRYLCITADPATLIQGAVPEILEQSAGDFFSKTNNTLREAADACYDTLSQIPSLTFPLKPQGAMCTMIQMKLALFKDVKDDMDFAFKLAAEESVLILPGSALGMKSNNWLRICFAVEVASLMDGLHRIKAFCLRHSI